jgi:hypothetical protein
MTRLPVKNLPFNCPDNLAEFFGDPPLVGDETLESYNTFFTAIIVGSKPANAIDWLYTRDVVDLSWQIRRERAILASVVKSFQREVIRDLLKSTVDAPDALSAAVNRIFDASDDMQRWASDPAARKEIDARLTASGYPLTAVLALAYMRGANQIEAIDKRIASYELRRVAIVREIDRRSERFARDLDSASSIIDGEFSEAAE